MDPKMNPLSCSICQNGAEANRLRSNCAEGGFETLRDGTSKHHGNKCTKRTLNDKIKEHGLCIICPCCFGKHAFRRTSSITEDENSARIKDNSITCRAFHKDGIAISSDNPEVAKTVKAVPSVNSILANMDHSLVSSPYKQTQNTTNTEHSLQEINTCECRPDLFNTRIDPCGGSTSMPIFQTTRDSNNTESLQGEKTDHSKLQDPQHKSISPLNDNTSRAEMKTQLEKSSIGITPTSETLLADKFLKSISISTRCSDEIEKFCYSQELSWLNQTLPKTRIICDSRDSAAEDEYLDTCDCEFCRIHTAATGSSLSTPGPLTGKVTETVDKEDYGLYVYNENDNECIWKYDEQDKSDGDCSDGAVHGDEEDCLRCGETDRSYSYQNDTDCASASDYSESERVGRLVSSLFTRNGRSYTFTDDEENDGDIDSSDDGRDVYMDALETSYV
ncbi:hypothetical protein MAR_011831 [Mya arenaria]|uniref:Uncharacterized protein n=1 Tax=Mya arenaria TaxID=6604 RepID=A0ABY7FYK8_MYAAR|nr:hypothetical protein MAR_011831 [Mya arenaria]